MWKPIAAGLILLAPGAFCQAAELNIPAGQVYTVSAAQSDLRLDKLSIGDNAQIRFAEGVQRWRVDAKQVSVGNNVSIDGRGAPGQSGQNGTLGGGMPKDCVDGASGGDGAAGARGGDGVALVFWWGVDEFGSMNIRTDGGSGGDGGKGARGQDGGRTNRCNGPKGGAGGAGGAGGSGGNGGAIALNYFAASGKTPAWEQRLAISAGGGAAGSGAAGGGGGAGAKGAFQKTPMSDRWFPDGPVGAAGAAGGAGAAGSVGAVAIQAVAASASPSWRGEAGSAAPADRGTLISLQQQVQALQGERAAPAAAQEPLAQQLRALQQQIERLEQRVRTLESR